MPNPKHLQILKQGVTVWNRWREEHPDIHPDLAGADLVDIDLTEANLIDANLRGADLTRARFSYAGHDMIKHTSPRNILQPISTRLIRSDLRSAELGDANLSFANLRGANLTNSNLQRADLRGAFLRQAVLCGADFRGADLPGADLCSADLGDADFWFADVGWMTLGNVDLSNVRGLEAVMHHGPSTIGVETLRKSKGLIPENFLRGCGLADWEIEAAKLYNPDLSEDQRTAITYEILRLQGEQPIQVNTLFVSYSHADDAFLVKLESKFDERGIRYWRDVHGLKAGRLETQIDRALRLNPTVLLVLSESSVESDWVEWEAAKARELEKETGRDVLCPVALDEAWKACAWPGQLRRQIEDYHILDFSGWQDLAIFERQFRKLLDGLKLFYKPKTCSGEKEPASQGQGCRSRDPMP